MSTAPIDGSLAGLGKLLVANRAEIAARVTATARRLGVPTVAVFSDADAALPYVSLADEAVHLPGAAPAETYLDIDALLGAARATGAGAVHPGYGFLSESAAFARACLGAGLTWVGPAPDMIEAMGSKTGAKAIMAEAGVPVLPGHVVEDGEVPTEAAERIGYPLLVKAVAGGGGRGMRVVAEPGALGDAVSGARREAASAFANGAVFLERLVVRPRHVEVQIMGDAHGHVVSLGERECSIQRRYQKIVEEAPAPGLTPELRDRLTKAAVRAGEALGYRGAGTVEFVVAPDGSFWFLEVNTRLQVEHPVTELVTGLDLVELQLRVAAGQPLPEGLARIEPRGHAVEARLYAEDARHDFAPSTGRLERFCVPELPGLRVDAGYREGCAVSPHYDAMLAKVIAWGEDRPGAARTLRRAMIGSRVVGVTTNLDLLAGVLGHPEFLAGTIDTDFLVRHPPDRLAAPSETERRLLAVAATLAVSARRLATAAVQRHVRPGFRNVPSAPARTVLADASGPIEVEVRRPREGSVDVAVDGSPEAVVVWSCTPEEVDLSLGGVRHHCLVDHCGAKVWVGSAGASAVLSVVPPFADPGAVEAAAGSLTAPLPGAVSQILVSVGQHVRGGDLLAVLEAMKMEHQVLAPRDGEVLAVQVAVGDQVQPGQPLVVLDGDGDAAGHD